MGLAASDESRYISLNLQFSYDLVREWAPRDPLFFIT
jgi:hypothetical protein